MSQTARLLRRAKEIGEKEGLRSYGRKTACGISADLASQLFQHLCSGVSDGFILICQGLLQEADGTLPTDLPQGVYRLLSEPGILIV